MCIENFGFSHKMQSVIYSTILSILSIEAVPHVQFVNTSSNSIMNAGNKGIIISDGGSSFHGQYKDCSSIADLSKYGKNNFQNINSTQVKINDPINRGYLLHVPNRGPGWKTKNKTIIKKVLDGDTYITDNDCGLTLYYSEEGELLFFKNNGIIVRDVFLQSNNLNDHGSYYEFKDLKWNIIIDKKSGKIIVSLVSDKKNTQYIPSLPGTPNVVKGRRVIQTDSTDFVTHNDIKMNTKNKSETQFHSDLINESSQESSSEIENDDVSGYEKADSECSHIPKSDETREKYESNVSPIPSASDYDTYSSTSSESKDDTYSSTSSESKDDTYSSTSSESKDDSSTSSESEDDTYSSISSESKDNTYSSNDHHTDKFSDNKIRKRFVFVDTL